MSSSCVLRVREREKVCVCVATLSNIFYETYFWILSSKNEMRTVDPSDDDDTQFRTDDSYQIIHEYV